MAVEGDIEREADAEPELVHTTAVVGTGLFGSVSPADTIAKATDVANALASVLETQKLFVQIRDRKHVRVEGWTLLGSMLGVYPVCTWTRPLIDSGGLTQGWEARVEARTLNGAIVGAAEAQCLRTEEQWGWTPVDRKGNPLQPRDDFALRSMAQTRATAKAMRLPLGFIVALAGYATTPAEEMPAEGSSNGYEHTPAPDQATPPRRPSSKGTYEYIEGSCATCGSQLLKRTASKGYEYATCELDYLVYLKDRQAIERLRAFEATNPEAVGKKHYWGRIVKEKKS